jgi:hypothetical protein
MKFQVVLLLAFLSVISYSQKITPVITFKDTLTVYGAGNITFHASSNSNGKIIYSVVKGLNDVIGAPYDATAYVLNAGTATIKATCQETQEYNQASKEINLYVSKRNLYVEANDESIVYGTLPGYSYTYTGWVNGPETLNENPKAGSIATKKTSPGTYPIKVSGGSSRNYFIIGLDGKLTISKRDLHAYLENVNRPYGDNNDKIHIRYDGFVNGEDSTELEIKPEWTCSADSTYPAGSYPIEFSVYADDNYNIIPHPENLIIEKASLVVSIDIVKREYGEENSPLNKINYDGFKLGQNVTIFETIPAVIEPNTDANSSIGEYPVYFTSHPDLKSGYKDNYDVTFNNGVFKILPAPFDITFHPMNRWVGMDNPIFSFDYNPGQFKLHDKISDLIPDTLPTADCEAYAVPGYYKIHFKDGQDRNPNYIYNEHDANLRVIDLPYLPKNIDPISTCKNVNCVLNPKNIALDVDKYTWLISDDAVSFDTIRPGNGFSGMNTNLLQIDTVKDGDEKKFFRCIVERSFYTDALKETGKQSEKDTSGIMQIELKDTPSNASIYFKTDHTLICLDDSVSSYQWGMGADPLPGETKQFYYDNNLQTDNLGSYWVVTTFDNGCATKSTYNGQPYIPDQNQMQEIGITIMPNPNNGDFQLHISNLITNTDVLISIHKYSGALMETTRIIHHYGDTESYHRKKMYGSGQYIVVVSQGNRRSIKKMIVQ